VTFWDRGNADTIQSWSISANGKVIFFSTSVEEMNNPTRKCVPYEVLDIGKILLNDAGRVLVQLDQDGIHIKISFDETLQIAVQKLTQNTSNKKLLKLKHTNEEAETQPVVNIIKGLTSNGELTLPLKAFYMPSPGEEENDKSKLGEEWIKTVNDIQRTFSVDWKSSLHQSTAMNRHHTSYLCHKMSAYLQAHMRSLGVTNKGPEFDMNTLTSLGLPAGTSTTAQTIREWDERNLALHGHFYSGGVPHSTYPMSFQLIGDARNRNESLVEVPFNHMKTPRSFERTRELSEVHVQDMMKGNANAKSHDDIGILILNVELAKGT
jgi:hypothetical protein